MSEDAIALDPFDRGITPGLHGPSVFNAIISVKADDLSMADAHNMYHDSDGGFFIEMEVCVMCSSNGYGPFCEDHKFLLNAEEWP